MSVRTALANPEDRPNKRKTQRRNTRRMSGTVYPRGKKWAYAFDGPPDPLTGERQRISKSGYETDDDAWAALAEARSKVLAGTHTKPSRLTVKEFFEVWFPKMRMTVEPTTANNYETLARSYVMPVIGKKRLQDVDSLTVSALYEHLLKEGRRKKTDTHYEMYVIWREVTERGEDIKAAELARKVGVSYWAARNAMLRFQAGRVPTQRPAGLAKKSVHSVKIMLKSAFSDAVVWGYVQTNPTIGVRGPSVKRRKHQTWTPTELATFLSAVKDERLYAMWILVATTGMRRSEIAGLQLGSLDLDHKALVVTNTRVVTSGKVHDGEGKSERSRRRLSLDNATVMVLRRHVRMIEDEKKTWGDHYQDHGLVFCWEDGRPIYPDTITEQLTRIADRLGLPPLTLHGLRHTYATTALRAGVHVKIVSSRLGHATVAFTLDTYTEDVPDLDEAAAQQISDLFIGIPGFDWGNLAGDAVNGTVALKPPAQT